MRPIEFIGFLTFVCLIMCIVDTCKGANKGARVFEWVFLCVMFTLVLLFA